MSDESTLPWERREGESLRHFDWFHAYLMLGPSRSVVEAYNVIGAKKGKAKQTQASGAWHKTYEKWNWRERAAAWDAWQQQQTEERLKERQRELEDRLFRVREKLVDKVEKMLDFPLHKVTTSANGGPTVIEPVRWNLNSVAHLLNAQQKLGGDSDIVKYIDLSALNEDQLLRLSKGENIYRVLGLMDGGPDLAANSSTASDSATNPHDDIADSSASGT